MDNKNIKCPQCKKKTSLGEDNPFRPFCSDRCKLLDLGAWASETYQIPGESVSIPDDEHLNNS